MQSHAIPVLAISKSVIFEYFCICVDEYAHIAVVNSDCESQVAVELTFDLSVSGLIILLFIFETACRFYNDWC